MDERAIIMRARAGDREAFGELVRRYQAHLRAYVARRVESSQDVYDIVQDAFLDALQNLDAFDLDRPVYPWLRSICHNRMLNYFRSQRRRRNQAQAVMDAALAEAAAPHADREEDTVERIEALKECIRGLTQAQRELLGQRYADGIAIKELAAQMRRSAASITMKLRRIRIVLFDCVQQRLQLANP
jgi:RNA polymerase sigma-70 factor (ECF subfamily)